MKDFYIAHEDDIKSGKTTDVYFIRTKKVLEEKGIHKKVFADITTTSLPKGWKWGVLAGVEEVAKLLEGHPVNVYSMPEGTIFHPYEPVMQIEGYYEEFGIFETALLGMLSQASGIATAALRVKMAAKFKPVYSFGIRHMHPAIAPMIDRSAFIGGCDGVSGVLGAEMIGEKPVGTMPHALIITVGDQVKAWKYFDEVMPEEVPRVALVDTFCDEKMEALMAAEALGEKLAAVRLDTPSSRRGNFKRIVEEVRWELDLRGYKHVKIFLSGGLNEESIKELADIADAFGVGGSIASAKPIDFSLDIVEVEGKPLTKRGKLSGRKQIYRCENGHYHRVPAEKKLEKCPVCGAKVEPLLKPLIENGEIVAELPKAREIREYVLEQAKKFGLTLE
ncbi:MAG: nicotinate phosphoribosyltransferase [Thermococcaceae archaeon]|jgi:nicotinate phosphoribosyltransferase|uniref:nicotinate phosphoribosyltransferase n=1 Tax=unclassified Thermococcus TaxID=2627626 RepID=UPI0005B28F28|nr:MULTISPECIES: nicotinate phosphoribosyltransferase [unclassified Thermococcus]MDK2782461.1 nicotinate phosphoribosyltransferase [Thermococcaceae archaeon]MDK2983157.1 nicotinate phosphoribosyltransferase [Thermococcaceae archaeon]MDN5320621.1 nicotinate phosphoribosyltransferase [Thermococcaceae archaeon]MPW39164.1 nicotinate phosphoribosyltransferase [Thermococcus sp. 101 C5]